MNKSLIITLVISFAILGFLFAGVQYFNKKVVRPAVNQAQGVARSAALRSVTAMIPFHIEIWGGNNNSSFADFMSNSKNAADVELLIADLEKKGAVRHHIATTKVGYVVRIGEMNSATYFCSDSRGLGTEEVTESSAVPFDSQTLCNGKPL